MPESLYFALVSSLHKVTFSEKLNSSLITKSFLSHKYIQDVGKSQNHKAL